MLESNLMFETIQSDLDQGMVEISVYYLTIVMY